MDVGVFFFFSVGVSFVGGGVGVVVDSAAATAVATNAEVGHTLVDHSFYCYFGWYFCRELYCY